MVFCKIDQSSLFYELIFACLFKCKFCPISNDWIAEDQKKLKVEIKPLRNIFYNNLFYSTEIKKDINEVISNLDLEYNFLLISSSGTTSNNIKIIQHSLKIFSKFQILQDLQSQKKINILCFLATVIYGRNI